MPVLLFRVFLSGDDKKPFFVKAPLCISLLNTESRPRSEHTERKTATFDTFLSILVCKDTLEFQADS